MIRLLGHEMTLRAWSWRPGRKARDAAHALSMVQRVAAVGGNPEAAMPRNAAAAAAERACRTRQARSAFHATASRAGISSNRRDAAPGSPAFA